jgi:two-component system sensor histidine kinase BaeS
MWLPRSLRAQLLLATVPVAVLAALASAWVANRQTRAAVTDEFEREYEEPEKIARSLEFLASQENGWATADDIVDEVASRYERRVVVVIDLPDQDLTVDSDPPPDRGASRALPQIFAGTIQPVLRPEAAPRRAQMVAEFRTDCLTELGVRFELRTVEGIRQADSASTDASECDEPTRDYESSLFAHEAQVFVDYDQPTAPGSVISGRLVSIVAGLVGLMALIAVLASRRVLRPVGQLTRVVGHVAAGSFGERVPERRRDEIGELARSFNAMAGALQRADEQRRRMTSDIAHELRTPLSNIRGYLEAAQDGVAPLTPELIDSIHEDTLLLQALVSDLQELAQAEAGQLRLDRSQLDAADLARSVVAAHGARAVTQQVRLTVTAADRCLVDGDHRRLRQVLTNLVENALRHTPPQGEITVSARSRGGWVEVAVADTGTGIAAEHLDRIFDRFFRADPSRHRSTGGSGLGLAITRELVHAHGGQIRVQSEVGRGTVFTVALPAVPPAAPSAAVGQAGPAAAAQASEVLVAAGGTGVEAVTDVDR